MEKNKKKSIVIKISILFFLLALLIVPRFFSKPDDEKSPVIPPNTEAVTVESIEKVDNNLEITISFDEKKFLLNTDKITKYGVMITKDNASLQEELSIPTLDVGVGKITWENCIDKNSDVEFSVIAFIVYHDDEDHYITNPQPYKKTINSETIKNYIEEIYIDIDLENYTGTIKNTNASLVVKDTPEVIENNGIKYTYVRMTITAKENYIINEDTKLYFKDMSKSNSEYELVLLENYEITDNGIVYLRRDTFSVIV